MKIWNRNKSSVIRDQNKTNLHENTNSKWNKFKLNKIRNNLNNFERSMTKAAQNYEEIN